MSTVRVANVWGWEQYFNELIIFLRHANRNLGTADWNHAAHIIAGAYTGFIKGGFHQLAVYIC